MTAPAGLDLRGLTGYWLRRAHVRAVGVERSCIGDEAPLREVAALSILAELGSLSQRELGAVTHISPTVMVRLVDALEARDWVSRQRKEGDRRSYALALTARGRTALRRLTRDLNASDAQLTHDLTAGEVDRLGAHLRAVLAGDPALDVTSMSTRVGYLISHAHERIRERARRQLTELDLHPRDFGLLTTIARDEPCSQSHLAAALGVSDPAIVGPLDTLEGRGLLTRVRNADDRRISDVRLTPQGRAVLVGAQKEAAAIQAGLVRQLGADANADLRELLIRIVGEQISPSR